MNKLLSANFSRLKKDISFRIGILYMFAIGIIVPLSNFITMKNTVIPFPSNQVSASMLFLWRSFLPFSVVCLSERNTMTEP